MPSKSAKSCSEKKPTHLYEYAVVQFVPDIERGEFINIGLIMMCKRRKWLRTSFIVDRERLSAFCRDVNLDVLERQITGFERVAAGDTREGGPIALLEPHERFRWLTAVRSACLQTSRPHPGRSFDLDQTFESLFDVLVK